MDSRQRLGTQRRKRPKGTIIRNLRTQGVVFTTYGDLVEDLKPIIDFGTPRNAVYHCLLGQISDQERRDADCSRL
jgi:hypothetical protein